MEVKNSAIIKYLFIAFCLLELIGHAFELEILNQFSKPLLMPILLVYFKRGLKQPVTMPFILAMLALIFSWIGDVTLMYVDKGENYFLMGLGAFAIAHFFYAVSFNKAVSPLDGGQPISLGKGIGYAIPFVLFLIGLMSMLWSGLGAMKVPVLGYGSVIVIMTLSAVYRYGRTGVNGYNQVVMGALLFILSDTLLAINKFHTPMENEGIWIMSTYLLAQWNIINGLQKHFNNE